MNTVRVTFIGHPATGKTALIKQYLYHKTINEYLPTIQDTYNSLITVDGYKTEVTLVDTSGEEEFHLLRDSELTRTDYLVYVYSVTDLGSFVNAQEDIAECLSIIANNGNKGYPSILIIGNKCDASHRVISPEEGEKLKNKIQKVCPCAFFETSATTNLNLQRVFNTFVTGISTSEHKMNETKEQDKKYKKPVAFKTTLEDLDRPLSHQNRFIAFFSPRRKNEKR
ncbi:Ras family GTPase [Entamoeba histolytica]|uniref:Ras family GTPase n=3 Tax=Entamoeba histolytica TaxID=5759 RepID=C4LTF8_ENTH1|nr:Ras family GTPase [Entamoeba histolytica HM-1:IMSS]XP_657296.1 Ras family GTPase [Entamoeba histolytica HM-1:IMSS]EMD42426.1 Ras family gtpase [Entamoeba histolytica KU27]GAT91844.1 Ras family GTPase [Entamoeba histolytica]EAL42475.1 Ras family GTPase [Entamoeba histolytica HM-1:IMSS]EAL51917.1 Ras family GTPase [Entamoeba histolytica HM-1:IMSS]GAT93863.1 Ras family GTPase [Entamoeba histolytica]|eukprot:XP_647861.1 Ras family GTPase [Entamoeba histolytica HM-1:IMSS]